MSINLKPYGEQGDAPVIRFDVRRDKDVLEIEFTIAGLPTPMPASNIIGVRRSELWLDTCFECFLGSAQEAAYLEFNFSPKGDWQCYAFEDYRQGMQVSDAWRPRQFSISAAAQQPQQLRFRMASDDGWPISPRVQGAAIIVWEGAMLYYASDHGDQPDFHNPALFLEGTNFGL